MSKVVTDFPGSDREISQRPHQFIKSTVTVAYELDIKVPQQYEGIESFCEKPL